MTVIARRTQWGNIVESMCTPSLRPPCIFSFLFLIQGNTCDNNCYAKYAEGSIQNLEY